MQELFNLSSPFRIAVLCNPVTPLLYRHLLRLWRFLESIKRGLRLDGDHRWNLKFAL
jgi:hypothetical protein